MGSSSTGKQFNKELADALRADRAKTVDLHAQLETIRSFVNTDTPLKVATARIANMAISLTLEIR